MTLQYGEIAMYLLLSPLRCYERDTSSGWVNVSNWVDVTTGEEARSPCVEIQGASGCAGRLIRTQVWRSIYPQLHNEMGSRLRVSMTA